MCFGGKDNSRQQAAQAQAEQAAAEAARQSRIREGQANIDTAFGQFDDNYFGNFQKSFTDFYNPQIADQYARAKDKLIAALAGRGTLESTVGAAKFGDLEKTKLDSEADIGNRAVDETNNLRKQVEGTKSNLYEINRGAADPAGINARAIGEATSIVAPRTQSPLGDVFSTVLGSFARTNRADATSMSPKLPWNSSTASIGGRGSAIYG